MKWRRPGGRGGRRGKNLGPQAVPLIAPLTGMLLVLAIPPLQAAGSMGFGGFRPLEPGTTGQERQRPSRRYTGGDRPQGGQWAPGGAGSYPANPFPSSAYGTSGATGTGPAPFAGYPPSAWPPGGDAGGYPANPFPAPAYGPSGAVGAGSPAAPAHGPSGWVSDTAPGRDYQGAAPGYPQPSYGERNTPVIGQPAPSHGPAAIGPVDGWEGGAGTWPGDGAWPGGNPPEFQAPPQGYRFRDGPLQQAGPQFPRFRPSPMGVDSPYRWGGGNGSLGPPPVYRPLDGTMQGGQGENGANGTYPGQFPQPAYPQARRYADPRFRPLSD